MNKYDVVVFTTKILNKEKTDFGIVEDRIKYDDDNIFLKIIPFNIKLGFLYLFEYKCKKIGTFKNFNFKNDESNHLFKINDEIEINLSDDFYNEYIKFGYEYWNNIEEMKSTFKDIIKIKFRITEFWGPGIYHAESKIHDIRLNDDLILSFNTKI